MWNLWDVFDRQFFGSPRYFSMFPKTNSSQPENGWLGDYFDFGFRPIFRGYVWGRLHLNPHDQLKLAYCNGLSRATAFCPFSKPSLVQIGGKKVDNQKVKSTIILDNIPMMVNWFPRYIPTGGVSNHHVSITTTPLPWTLGTFTLIRPKHAISYGQIKQHDEIDLRCYVLLVPTGVIECLIPDISKRIIYSIDISKQWRPAHPVTAKVPARIIPVGTWLVTPFPFISH